MRAALAISQSTAKKAPAKKTTTSKAKGSSQQSMLSFAPSGRTSTRAAATRARGKLANTVRDSKIDGLSAYPWIAGGQR